MAETREEMLRQLREEHEELEREHRRLQRESPADLSTHAAHAEKLREHRQRLQIFAQGLRRDESPDVV